MWGFSTEINFATRNRQKFSCRRFKILNWLYFNNLKIRLQLTSLDRRRFFKRMRGFILCKEDETLMKSQLVSSKWKIEIFMYECSSRQEPNYPVIISLEACDEWTSNTFVKKITYCKQKPNFKWLIKRNHTEDNEKNKIEVLKLRSWANFDSTGKLKFFSNSVRQVSNLMLWSRFLIGVIFLERRFVKSDTWLASV